MGDITSIAWTDHTFNPVRGCRHALLDGAPSPACAAGPGCYAESWAKRNPAALGTWGADGARVMAADAYWRGPVKWNDAAEKAGKRARVFCASLADIFEGADVDGHESTTTIRADYLPMLARLFETIHATPRLDWQLLTKRPRLAAAWATNLGGWPDNAWIGATVENQRAADERIPWLLQVPARVRFLSMEPLFGRVDLRSMDVELHPAADHITAGEYNIGAYRIDALTGRNTDMARPCPDVNRLAWIIVGGQSGPGAAVLDTGAVADIVRQCRDAGVPCFVKQMGSAWARSNRSKSAKGEDPAEWPEELRIREWPGATP